MGFLGFESQKEKEEKLKREQERLDQERLEKEREEAIRKVPIYFTHAVDFDYSIVFGEAYAWCRYHDFEEAFETSYKILKESAINHNGDAIIDVKINISYAPRVNNGPPGYVVVMTGVVVRYI